MAMVSGKFSNSANETNTEIAVPSEDGVVRITAEMWEYNPNIIRVKRGQKVTIDLLNFDFPHGLEIPALNVSGINSITFTPKEAGELYFNCPTFCGAGHGNMEGKIIVE